MEKSNKFVAKMLENDAFSHWLGLEIEQLELGKCELSFTIRPEMLNGFGIVHGGVLFAAADSAFAFASNSHGRLSVALDVSISFVKSARVGERLRVCATEQHLGNKTGVYEVKIWNENTKLVVIFKGTVFRTEKMVSED